MTLLLPWNFFPFFERKGREEENRNEMYPTDFKRLIETRVGKKKKKNKSIFVRNISKLRKIRGGGGNIKEKKKRKIKQKEETTTLPK